MALAHFLYSYFAFSKYSVSALLVSEVAGTDMDLAALFPEGQR